MTTAPAPVAPAPPLSRNRDFALLWSGEAVSVLGSMTTLVVLPVLAVSLGASAGWMGVLTAAVWLPWLVLGLPAGAWVDRGDNRRLMIAADLLGALVLASVPLAWALGVLGLPHLVLAALGSGVKDVVFRTAYPGLLTRLVRPQDLEAANGRVYGTESAMQVAGPGAGGLLVQLVGGALALVVDVVSFVVSALCLWRIRGGRPERAAAGQERERVGPMVREGLRVTFGDRYLAWFTVQGGASNFALTGYQTLLVLFLLRDLEATPGSVGLLLALGATGGLVGAVVAARVSRLLGSARAMLVLQLAGGPPALLVGLAGPGHGIWLVPLGSALVGLGLVGANVVRGAFRQRWVPADLLGRTSGAAAVVNFGTMPLGALVAGGLGGAVGLRQTILLMAGLHVIATLATLLSPWARLRDLPSGRLDDPGRRDEARDRGGVRPGRAAAGAAAGRAPRRGRAARRR